MSKNRFSLSPTATLAVLVAIVAIVAVAFIAVRQQMQAGESALLMELARLEHASIADYEAAFGKPVYAVTDIRELHPELANTLKDGLPQGHKVWFFSAGTIPARFLVIISDADGRVVRRSWVPV